MRSLEIEYSHEFISNKIKDELILYNIWDFTALEKEIINDIKNIFSFNVGLNRNINSLSGGQRSIAYLVTLTFILKERNINKLNLKLFNIIESLTQDSGTKIIQYMNTRGINVT